MARLRFLSQRDMTLRPLLLSRCAVWSHLSKSRSWVQGGRLPVEDCRSRFRPLTPSARRGPCLQDASLFPHPQGRVHRRMLGGPCQGLAEWPQESPA